MTLLFGVTAVFLLAFIAFTLDLIRDELRDIADLLEYGPDGSSRRRHGPA